MSVQRHEHGGVSSADVIDPKRAISRSKVGEGHVVLDIGCSFGDYSMEASRSVGHGQVIGIDIHSGSLEKFRERIAERGLDNIRIIEGDVTKGIPLRTRSVDRILIFNVLHGFVHNGESKNVLNEMERVLKDDGLVSIIESRPGATGKGPPDGVRLNKNELTSLMTTIGLSMEEDLDISPYHDLFLFGRTMDQGQLRIENVNKVVHHITPGEDRRTGDPVVGR